MALTRARKRELLERELPRDREATAIVKDYLSRTGLQVADFAKRINYSYVALTKWLNGNYQGISGSTANIRATSLDFIQAHPAGSGDDSYSGKLYDTENVRLVRKYFDAALDERRAYYCHGDPGTQKSFIAEALIGELNCKELHKNGHGRRAYYIYCREGIRPSDLMKRVAAAVGSTNAGNIDRLINNLRFDFNGRRVLLIFDEAQHLSTECLEIVRELFDRKPHFGLLFLGSHDLKQKFTQNPIELEQWNSRIHAGKSLPGITDEEATTIIRSELGANIKVTMIEKLIDSARIESPQLTREARFQEASEIANGRKKLKGEKAAPITYISARRLFWSIAEIQSKLANKKEATA